MIGRLARQNLWNDVLGLEKKCQERPVFRTLSGNIIVGEPVIGRAMLASTGTLVSRPPAYWRRGHEAVPEPLRRKLNRWVVERLYQQDPVTAVETTLKRVTSEEGDLLQICVQSVVDGLAVPMGCATSPRLERAVRGFFDQVFIPSALGTIRQKDNKSLFERACDDAGAALAEMDHKVFLQDLGFEDDPDYHSMLGELYLRRAAAFVASTATVLAWLLSALYSDRHVTLSGAVSRQRVRSMDPKWTALECLRLWPPIWRLNRTVVTDHQVGPVRALKADTVELSLYSAQRHPGFWPDPNSFDPSRWQDLSVHSLLVFGKGEGSCLGAKFAVDWLSTAVSQLDAHDLKVTQIGRRPHATTSFSPPVSHLGAR